MGGLGRTLVLPSTPGPVLLSSPDPGVTSIGRPTGGELLVGWDPCPHQCTWDGWGRGPGPQGGCVLPVSQQRSLPAPHSLCPHGERPLGCSCHWKGGQGCRLAACVAAGGHRWPSHTHSGQWAEESPLSLPCTCCAPTPTPHPMNTGSALGCGRYGEPFGGSV